MLYKVTYVENGDLKEWTFKNKKQLESFLNEFNRPYTDEDFNNCISSIFQGFELDIETLNRK